MAVNIQSTLLNTSIGIGELMAPPDAGKLPDARELASSVLQETSLESLYGEGNAKTACEAFLCPKVSDVSLLAPEAFAGQMRSLVAKLEGSDNPKIKALLANEIMPLMQNGMLFDAYRGLMLGS
ncbi:MAG: type III secretion protein [Duodenibacillus sp.]|nr:type III secretion protein [Duodenibacillus sp.]